MKYHINSNVKHPINKYMTIIRKVQDQIVNSLKNDKDTVFSMFFRGESNKHLCPNVAGILRSSSNRKKESILYNRYESYFISKLSQINNPFDKLEFMQHYGLYTRLLDITKDPLVALYFACSKHIGEAPGFIYIFVGFSGDTFSTSLNFNDDSVKLLATLSTMNPSDKNLITNYLNILLDELNKDSLIFLNTCPYRTYRFLKDTYRNMRNKYKDIDSFNHIYKTIQEFYSMEEVHELYLKSFLSYKYPLNLLPFIDKSLIINPDRNNDRIKAQDGYFLFQSYFSKNFQNDESISNDVHRKVYTTIQISKNCKKKILFELDKLYGINKAKLFPNYSSVASYLNKHINDL